MIKYNFKLLQLKYLLQHIDTGVPGHVCVLENNVKKVQKVDVK